MMIIFKYKAELLGNTATQPAPNAIYGILKNAIIAVPLKYLKLASAIFYQIFIFHQMIALQRLKNVFYFI